ncbi:hypothetical protein JXO52_07850 [bacterium]|nr:hypothetical protein [bacterium]
MKVTETLGTLFLGIWLVVTGVQDLLNRSIPVVNDLMPLLAVLAGIFIIIGSAKLPGKLGGVLLAVWLILTGLAPYLDLRGDIVAILLSGFAVVAGILILIKR